MVRTFGTKAENIQVFFGETVCDKVTLNDKGNIVVNVPKGVSSEAPVKIKLIIQGKEIEMGESGTFEVWETPEITSVETPYIYPMPRMSKKRKHELSFYLNDRGRVTYNELCRKCQHGCRQSFRAVVVDCPRYLSKRAKKKEEHTE